MISFIDKNNVRITFWIENGEKGELQLLNTHTGELIKIHFNHIRLFELKNFINANFELTKEN